MMWKRPVTDIFSLYKSASTLNYFHFRRYRILNPYCIISFLCLKYQNSVKNIVSIKNCIKYYVPNFLKRFAFTREKNIRTTPDDSLYITTILFSLFFIRTIWYEQNSWFWPKKVKNKIRTKPGLLSHRILEQSV